MTRKPVTSAYWEDRLPHWEVEDGRYFVTIHTAGAIPQQGRDQLVRLADQLRQASPRSPLPWLEKQRAIFREMEKWLDASRWNPLLQRSDVAAMVIEAIEHRKRRGIWTLFEYVVMPTHLHLFGEMGRAGLKNTMKEFKRWTGHEANRILKTKGKRFWQREWFDHWSRSDAEDDRIVYYIRHNPVRAGLVQRYTDWPYGSWQVHPAVRELRGLRKLI